MEISFRRSNFAQFSNSAWLRVEHDGATIDFDVYPEESHGFAMMLLDVAYDVLSKQGKYDNICDVIATALNTLEDEEYEK